MKKRVRWLMAFVILGCMLLSGCSPRIISPDMLMRPPHSYGDPELRQAFEAYFSSQNKQASDVVLKTPSSGEYRSAYVMADVDGDGDDEAMVFYTLRSDKTICNINLLDQVNGIWNTIGTYKGSGGEVLRLSFLSMDGEKAPEILVEWGSADSTEKSISLLSYDASEGASSRLTSLAGGPVLAVQPVDIDADGYMEIFLMTPSTAELTKNSTRAQLLRLLDGKIVIISDLPLENRVLSYSDIHIQLRYDDQPLCIYLDCAIDSKKMMTQILYWNDSEQRLYHAASVRTLRAQAITTRDINQDGAMEIPVGAPLSGSVSDDSAVNTQLDQSAAPSNDAEAVITPYPVLPTEIEMTVWNQFRIQNGQSTLIPVLYSAIKFSDSYLFTFPQEWIAEDGTNRVTIRNSISDRRWSFFAFDQQTGVGMPLFHIVTVPEGEWQKNPAQGYTRINSNGSLVYAVKLENAAVEWKITLELIKANLMILD